MLTTLLLLWPAVVVMSMRGPHHPRGKHIHYRPKQDGPKLTQDNQLLHDVDHIQEDLGESISNDYLKKMTPEELEFHYFKIHDFDNNTKLDGLEILQAIRHTLEHEHLKGTRDKEEEAKLQELSEGLTEEGLENEFSYIVDLIDQVLIEDDTDEDGYLSYIEYVIGRQRDQNKKQKLLQT